MKKKKILYISDCNFSVVGGAQKSMQIIMEGLSEYFDFWVIMPGKEHPILDPKCHSFVLAQFDWFRFNKSPIRIGKTFSAISDAVREIDPDLIHTQMPTGMAAVLTLKLFKKIKCPVIHTDRGVFDQYDMRWQWFLKRMVKVSDAFVLTTNYCHAIYKNMLPSYSEKMLVIPNTPGPLFEEYAPEREITNSGRTIQNVMFNARYTSDKNWPLAVEIMSYLVENKPVALTVVVGSDGSGESKSECSEFKIRLERLFGSRVQCYIDLPLEAVDQLLYDADLLVMTSKTESFGRTAVEAMARKCIVFGTKVDGLAEVIGRDDSLFLNKMEFIEKYEAFEQLDIDEEKHKFYQRFLNNYSLKNNLYKHMVLYNSILF